VYTQWFTDDKGNMSRHPGAPTWPEKMKTTVQLTEEGPNQTRVTVTWEAEGPATAAEMAAFLKERPGMTVGWTGSFDKLEELVESV
ncbi:MAG TPA: SRPBCC domain-containing protein, partial [Bdellovibrionales bacterium]|nr:SRPBCC domain-containing protein [Bdellovibrionales bacterium]